jgi:hypothetical protein
MRARVLLPLLALLLAGCQMGTPEDDGLGPGKTAFATDGMTIVVTRRASNLADVTIVSGVTLSRELAEAIAAQAAREATRCGSVRPRLTRLTPSEGDVRVALDRCGASNG